MARNLGLDINKVYLLVYAIGSGLFGVAAFLFTLKNVAYPTMGIFPFFHVFHRGVSGWDQQHRRACPGRFHFGDGGKPRDDHPPRRIQDYDRLRDSFHGDFNQTGRIIGLQERIAASGLRLSCSDSRHHVRHSGPVPEPDHGVRRRHLHGPRRFQRDRRLLRGPDQHPFRVQLPGRHGRGVRPFRGRGRAPGPSLPAGQG